MSFQEWLDNGWIKKHKTSNQEISDLLDVVERDLKDCYLPGLSADRKLCTAHNAIIQIAIAALAISGYRLTRESHHYNAIHSLELTLELPSSSVEKLNEFRKKRNMCDYERAGAISDYEAEEVIKTAEELRAKFIVWFEKKD